MSLRNKFRIRSRQSGRSKDTSLQPQQDSWFDLLNEKKTRCRKTLDDSYGSISLQQAQLRQAIRGVSADRPNAGKQNTITNLNSQTSIHQRLEVDKLKRQQINRELKQAVRALTHLQKEFVPSQVDSFHLNQQLVRKDNDPLWNKLSQNPRNPQLMLYKSYNTQIGGRGNYIFKITKMHRKYILKVVGPEGRYGLILNRDQWEALWKDHPSYQQISAILRLGTDGKLIIDNDIHTDKGVQSQTSSYRIDEVDRS